MDALSRASLLALTAAALAALLCGCEDGGGGGPSLPVVTITATDASAAEEGSDPGTFTLTRTGETIDDLVVYFSIATGAGEATNDVDYQEQASAGPLPASATIPAGETTVAITIVPVDDAEIEGPETVTLTLLRQHLHGGGAGGPDREGDDRGQRGAAARDQHRRDRRGRSGGGVRSRNVHGLADRQHC